MDVETLLVHLKAGDLPVEGRCWLIDGFEAWQQGANLEDALHLRRLPLDARDEQLRVILRLTPGASSTAKCALLLECLDGREHPAQMADGMLRNLLRTGVLIPRSIKQLRRILNGRRQDGWRQGLTLCPPWPSAQNG